MRLRSFVAAATLLAANLCARADVINYQLSNVSFVSPAGAPAGTLSGTFSYDTSTKAITTYDLTASSYASLNPAVYSFSGFEYTPSDSIVSAQSLPSQYFRIDAMAGAELQLYFQAGLGPSGGTLLPGASYEQEAFSGGTRYASGSVVLQRSARAGTPEPSSLAFLGTGILSVAGVVRKRFAR